MTTKKLDLSRARPHDLGGQPAGRVDPSDHGLEPWHRLVTGLLNALRDRPEKRLIHVDEMRRAIEDLPPEDYRNLAYFEKWAHVIQLSGEAPRSRLISILIELMKVDFGTIQRFSGAAG